MLVTGAGQLRVKLIKEKTLSDAITALEKKKEYTTPLTWAGTPEGTGHALFQSLMDMPKSIIGKAPNEFATMQSVSNIPSPLPSLDGDNCVGCTNFSTIMVVTDYCQCLKMGTVSLAVSEGAQVCHMTLLMCMSEGFCSRGSVTTRGFCLTSSNVALPRHMGMTGIQRRSCKGRLRLERFPLRI